MRYSLLSFVFIMLIKGYRRFISPLKGYSCAYSVIYKCETCSDFGLKSFRENTPHKAYRLTRERQIKCETLFQHYLRTLSQEERENRQNRIELRRKKSMITLFGGKKQ